MQATLIYGAVPFYDYGLSIVTDLIAKTLSELEVSVTTLKLSELNLPVFEGRKNPEIQSVIELLSKSEAIIFATTSQINNICSIMKAFVEYFEIDDLKNCISGKNCMIVTVADITGEKDAADYISKVLGKFSGNEAIRIAIGGNMSTEIGNSSFIEEVVEKQVEDYYRIAKQNRKFIPSSESAEMPVSTAAKEKRVPNEAPELLEDMSIETTQLLHTPASQSVSSGINMFNKKQEDDIADLARLFEKKITSKTQTNNIEVPGTYKKPLLQNEPSAIQHRVKTCKQMTMNLPHYFQPQVSAGLQCTVQLNITGSEAFECYLSIHGLECEITEGSSPEPDIIIISDADIWQNCLRGKFSVQKAFMTGQLKVRGNFMLLNKFDVIFKKM